MFRFLYLLIYILTVAQTHIDGGAVNAINNQRTLAIGNAQHVSLAPPGVARTHFITRITLINRQLAAWSLGVKSPPLASLQEATALEGFVHNR